MIRRMSIDDYEDLYALWTSCKGMGLNDVDDSREGIKRYLTRNPNTCFVAEEGGQIIGAILSGHDGRRGFIYHAAVSANHRGAGVGSALCDAALRALADEGVSKVALVAFSDNAAGNAFWAQQGFVLRDDLSYRSRIILNASQRGTR